MALLYSGFRRFLCVQMKGLQVEMQDPPDDALFCEREKAAERKPQDSVIASVNWEATGKNFRKANLKRIGP